MLTNQSTEAVLFWSTKTKQDCFLVPKVLIGYVWQHDHFSLTGVIGKCSINILNPVRDIFKTSKSVLLEDESAYSWFRK